MQTIITFKDGREETTEGAMPNCYESGVSLLDELDGVVSDVPLETVQRIVFEND